jgi:hypothetical protein
MSDNENRFMDEFGEYDDWIEIYNDNPFPVNLGGLYLSDSMPRADRFRIPSNNLDATVIPAKGYLVIWTDGDTDQGPLHTNFKLNRDGEDLVLSAYDHRKTIHHVSFAKQFSNFSRGRLNDNGPWQDIPPSPGAKNVLPDLSSLYINEIMPYNPRIIADDHGEFDDWIELYNGGSEAIDLGGLFISDSIGDPEPFRISSDYPDSTTLEPSRFLLIWADDSKAQGILHSDFKLSRSGEQLVLFAYDGQTIIDSVSYRQVQRSHSFGRVSDGDYPWAETASPTPYESNMLTGAGKLQTDLSRISCEIYPNPASGHVIISMQIAGPTEVLM